MPSHRELGDATCPFCSADLPGQAKATNGSVFAIPDMYPVTPNHLLIIPRRHTEDYFTMTASERRDAEELVLRLREEIRNSDETVVAFNVGINCGRAAGQTIMHAHIHLIPRRLGDTTKPEGGVRGVIPGRRGYQLPAESVQH